MPRKKPSESLTFRIFLMTAAILFCSCAVTFGLIAWATPSVYTAMANDDLQRQTDDLVSRLSETDFSDCGPVLDEFIRTSGSDIMLLDENGNAVDTGGFSLQPVSGDENTAISSSAPGEEKGSGVSDDFSPFGSDVKSGSVSATWVQTSEEENSTGIITTLQQDAVFAEVSFADRGETYRLYVTPHTEEENLAVKAMIRMAPWLLLALLVFSLLCAVLYSRCITRPIVRLSAIAKKMAGLDFDLECKEQRPDEIGALGRSLDQMAGRLSSALKELENTNLALRREMEKERDMERRRTAFFSAASHELKTPVTILRGQLTGMLEGIDVYRDRDRYLLRSLQVTGRMENLIRGNARHLPDGGRNGRNPSGIPSSFRPHRKTDDSVRRTGRAARTAPDLRTVVRCHCDRQSLPPGKSHRQSSLKRFSLLSGRSRDPRPVRQKTGTSRHHSGKYRNPYQRGISASPLRRFLPRREFPQPQHRRKRSGTLSGADDPEAP